jgi:DUF2075 family protein
LYKTLYKNDPEEANRLADPIIKNAYRTLMTRGQKGCYIFCVDEETNEYFKKFVDHEMKSNVAEDWLKKAAEPGAPEY